MGADGLLLRLVLHKRGEHKVDLLLFRALLVGLLHLVTGSSGGRLSDLPTAAHLTYRDGTDPHESADYKLSMRLVDKYPQGYNVLPTANPHDVVHVSLQLALYHIVDMNEKAQTLTTNCEVITKWNDVFLVWDPEDYGNITSTRLPWETVWTPDIVLYNAAGDGEQGREMRTLIQVDYQGNVTLLTQAIYMSKCKIDVTYYPFDTQMCELKFASWTTEVTRINMTIGDISEKEILSLYSPSGVFELKKFWAERHEEKDPCCVDPFADVTYYILIWRRPEFFLFNYIQPAVLINILALFVFLIPAESGEKITLGISTMLNMTVFLMTVTSGIPPTDQTPILSMYYATVMVLTTAATVLGVMVLRIHHQGRRGIPVPIYLRKMAQWMAVMTFYKYPPIEKQLENLNNGIYSPGIRSEPYTYNIKDKLGEHGNSNFSKKLAFLNQQKKTAARKKERVSYKDSKCENTLTRTCSKRSLNGSPRYRRRPNSLSSLTMKNEAVDSSMRSLNKTSYPKLEMMRTSEDEDYSDMKTEDEEAQPMVVKTIGLKPALKPAGGLWKKVAKNVDETKEAKQAEEKSPWKDLSTAIMEERYKQEERKEIIGEEWRKISRIFDRFLLVLFTAVSLITTVICIYASPHFPDPGEGGNIDLDEFYDHQNERPKILQDQHQGR